MTPYELKLEFEKMCDLQPQCNTCKYKDVNAPCALVYGYERGKADGSFQGRADAIEEVKSKMISFHTDAIFQYGADIIEARVDAFDELKDWVEEQMKEQT